MANREAKFVRAVSVTQLKATGCLPVQLNGHTVALFADGEKIFAVDNRCPHMGFPLERGTVKDRILTCHWHHARFDLESGGTFDQWADDVRSYPVEIREDEVWVDVAQHNDPREHHRQRLRVGLERDLSLVLGKAVLTLLQDGGDPNVPFWAGLDFGTTFLRRGWRQGLTIHTCMMNLMPYLDAEDRPRALFHGLSAVSQETFSQPPRFPVRPLPTETTDFPTLKRWFRRFAEVRDTDGAERCVISAIRTGADDQQMADMLFAAVTDHRYIDIGHPVDFTNKAFEALDIAGWQHAEQVLSSLVRGYTTADRMEESNAWRNPVDLIDILENTFKVLSETIEVGQQVRAGGHVWIREADMVPVLHGDDPQLIVETLLQALRAGATEVDLAAAVSYAAALRIAQFHTSNEFPDWDTALHTFTFANAVEQGLRRFPSTELLRGVFDAAMSVYLDRFLNIPAAQLPEPDSTNGDPADLLKELVRLLDRQQQVNQAGALVAQYFHNGGDPDRLLATIGHLLLREDRDFHTIQTVEAAVRQYQRLRGTDAATHVLLAAIRYLAAHSPTVRAQGQTYEIAFRLHKGDRLFEEA